MRIVIDKPRFSVDQVNSATYASKRFGEIWKKAKELPQFISENNCVYTVVLDYKTYEKMYAELQALREMTWELEIVRRLEKADSTNIKFSLPEVLGKEGYKEFCNINPDSVPDEELFE